MTDTYKFWITELGGVFNRKKDVEGKHTRGVFTEILFEDNQILLVPKMRTIVRAEDNRNKGAAND